MQIWGSGQSSGMKTQKWEVVPKAKRMDEVTQGDNGGERNGRKGKGREQCSEQHSGV